MQSFFNFSRITSTRLDNIRLNGQMSIFCDKQCDKYILVTSRPGNMAMFNLLYLFNDEIYKIKTLTLYWDTPCVKRNQQNNYHRRFDENLKAYFAFILMIFFYQYWFDKFAQFDCKRPRIIIVFSFLLLLPLGWKFLRVRKKWVIFCDKLWPSIT